MPDDFPPFPTAEAGEGLDKAIERVRTEHERIALTRGGEPVAALVSLSDAKLLEEIEDRLDALDALAEHERSGGETVGWEALRAELLK